MPSSTDRIEKKTLLRAPRERVWRAITEARQFGAWFGVELDGPFVAGARVAGRIAKTKVDPEIAKMQEPHVGVPCEFLVERIEPMRLFTFRWHPSAVDPAADYATEETTLVAFELEDAPGGTRLTITETGFDRIPLARRAEAFSNNEEGWAAQLELIGKYLALSEGR